MNRRQFFGTLTAGLAYLGLGPKVEARPNGVILGSNGKECMCHWAFGGRPVVCDYHAGLMRPHPKQLEFLIDDSPRRIYMGGRYIGTLRKAGRG